MGLADKIVTILLMTALLQVSTAGSFVGWSIPSNKWISAENLLLHVEVGDVIGMLLILSISIILIRLVSVVAIMLLRLVSLIFIIPFRLVRYFYKGLLAFCWFCTWSYIVSKLLNTYIN